MVEHQLVLFLRIRFQIQFGILNKLYRIPVSVGPLARNVVMTATAAQDCVTQLPA